MEITALEVKLEKQNQALEEERREREAFEEEARINLQKMLDKEEELKEMVVVARRLE